MLEHIWSNRFLVVCTALLLVVHPPKSLSTADRQAAESREIRWEFDSGG
jgi:hypothetical protein